MLIVIVFEKPFLPIKAAATLIRADDYWFGWSELKKEIELIQDGGHKRQKDVYHHSPIPYFLITLYL